MSGFQLRLDGAETGLDLVEHELMLIIVQNFGAAPVASALQHLQDRLKPGDPSFRVLIGSTQLGSLRFERVGLVPHGQHHGLQRLDIIGKCGRRVGHAKNLITKRTEMRVLSVPRVTLSQIYPTLSG